MDVAIAHRAIAHFYGEGKYKLPKELNSLLRSWITESFASSYHGIFWAIARKVGEERTRERQREIMT